MSKSEALARLEEIVKGIDQAEGDAFPDDGWWETSTGADFGAGILEQLRQLVSDLTGVAR